MLLKECDLLDSDRVAQTQTPITPFDRDSFLADIDATITLSTLEAQLEKQIDDLRRVPNHVKHCHGLETVWLVQQKKTIGDLADRFLKELNQFKHCQGSQKISTLDLLEKEIMEGKKYDTQIHYDDYKTFDGNMRSHAENEHFRHKHLISELKAFFDNTERTREEKKAIEALIIFAIFLEATWDFYKLLESWHIEYNIAYNKGKKFSHYLTDDIPNAAARYLWLLDNLSYKCNPTIYKLLSALNDTALRLVPSFLFIMPFVVVGILFPEPIALIVIAVLAIILSVFCLFGPLCRLLPDWSWEKNKFTKDWIDSRWGTNWAHRLPNNATDESKGYGNDNPNATGIFPSVLGYPAIRAGSSFKVMNRLGFFPFKETANESIELTERLLENTTGKNFIHINPCLY